MKYMDEYVSTSERRRMLRRDHVFAACVVASGWFFFGFFGFATMTGMTAVGAWIAAVCGCAVFIALAIIFTITVATTCAIAPTVAAACVPTLLFGAGVVHAGVAVLGVALLYYGVRVMRRTVFNVIRLDAGLVVQSGIFYVMTALVIITSSHYYFYLKQHMSDVAAPHLSPTVSNVVAGQVVASSEMAGETSMTVDDYLRDLVRKQLTTDGLQTATALVTPQWLHAPTHLAMDYTITQLREVAGTMIGREVRGTDLARDVFADMIDMQVSNLINRNQTFHKYRVEIFGTTFFVVAMMVSPVIRFVATIGVRGGVALLRRYGLVRTVRRTVHVETIMF